MPPLRLTPASAAIASTSKTEAQRIRGALEAASLNVFEKAKKEAAQTRQKLFKSMYPERFAEQYPEATKAKKPVAKDYKEELRAKIARRKNAADGAEAAADDAPAAPLSAAEAALAPQGDVRAAFSELFGPEGPHHAQFLEALQQLVGSDLRESGERDDAAIAEAQVAYLQRVHEVVLDLKETKNDLLRDYYLDTVFAADARGKLAITKAKSDALLEFNTRYKPANATATTWDATLQALGERAEEVTERLAPLIPQLENPTGGVAEIRTILQALESILSQKDEYRTAFITTLMVQLQGAALKQIEEAEAAATKFEGLGALKSACSKVAVTSYRKNPRALKLANSYKQPPEGGALTLLAIVQQRAAQFRRDHPRRAVAPECNKGLATLDALRTMRADNAKARAKSEDLLRNVVDNQAQRAKADAEYRQMIAAITQAVDAGTGSMDDALARLEKIQAARTKLVAEFEADAQTRAKMEQNIQTSQREEAADIAKLRAETSAELRAATAWLLTQVDLFEDVVRQLVAPSGGVSTRLGLLCDAALPIGPGVATAAGFANADPTVPSCFLRQDGLLRASGVQRVWDYVAREQWGAERVFSLDKARKGVYLVGGRQPKVCKTTCGQTLFLSTPASAHIPHCRDDSAQPVPCVVPAAQARTLRQNEVDCNVTEADVARYSQSNQAQLAQERAQQAAAMEEQENARIAARKTSARARGGGGAAYSAAAAAGRRGGLGLDPEIAARLRKWEDERTLFVAEAIKRNQNAEDAKKLFAQEHPPPQAGDMFAAMQRKLKKVEVKEYEPTAHLRGAWNSAVAKTTAS